MITRFIRLTRLRQWTRLAIVLGGAAVVVGSVAPTVAQDERAGRHRVPAEFMSFRGADWLERVERADEEQPDHVVAMMELEPGDIVADVGCGTGYYARRIAPHVRPGGRVYCEDIQPEMLELMAERAAAEGVTGIEAVLGTPVDPRLPAGAVDWVILADVYHEMSEPATMLDGIRQSLSRDGRVALLEYRMEDGTGDTIKADHRMSVRQVLREWRQAGFELVALHDFLPTQHLFVFRSADRDSSGPPLPDHDLVEALDRGLVEVDARGGGDDEVVVRIRRAGARPIVVTSPVGTRFRAEDPPREMVARRDGWIVLDDETWHSWSFRVVARQPEPAPPDEGVSVTVLPPPTTSPGTEVLYWAQVGTYTVADSPTLYLPPVQVIEQAAVWIATADVGYDTLDVRLHDERMPTPYVVAFALVLVDRAGIDVAARRVWDERERVFGRLRDPGLTLWYRLRAAA